jgi:gliding motility-associated-like protein
MRAVVLIGFFVILGLQGSGLYGQARFFTRYASQGTEQVNSIFEMPNQQGYWVQIHGAINSPANSLIGSGILQIDAEGNLVNRAIYSLGDTSLMLQKIIPDGAGAIGCGSGGSLNQHSRAIITRHQGNGEIAQTLSLRATEADQAFDIERLPNGNTVALLCGNYNVGYEEAWLVELDSALHVLRSLRISVLSAELNPVALAVSPSGRIAIASVTRGNPYFNDAAMLVLKSNWQYDWGKRFGTYYDEEIQDLVFEDESTLQAVGFSYHLATQWDGWWMRWKINTPAPELRYFDAGGDEKFRKLAIRKGQVLITGDAGSFEERKIVWGFVADGALNQGKMLDWGSPFTNYPYTLSATSDGGWILGGDFTNPNASRDAGVLKLDAEASPGCNILPWAASRIDSVPRVQAFYPYIQTDSVVVVPREANKEPNIYFDLIVCSEIPPVADFRLVSDSLACPERCYIFRDTSRYADTLWWRGPDGQLWESNDTVFTICRPDAFPFTMQRIAANASGRDTLSIVVKPSKACPLQIPNVISPNGDGINDAFVMDELPDQSVLWMYNRWGNAIFYSASYANNWSSNTSGVYYYVLQLPDGQQYKGFVQVIAP